MSFQIFRLIYLFALAVELYAGAAQNLALQYFSKPSLMLLLIVYYAFGAKGLSKEKYPMILALLFSWFGDVFLLLDKEYKSFFICGLGAFLAAHLCYIFYFWRVRKLNRVSKIPNKLIFAAIAVYTLSLFGLVAPHVGNLIVPVAVYALVISLMLAVSLTAFDLGRQNFGKICVAGTIIFLISDSLLAVNRFVVPFALGPFLIMLTYALAQLLIAEGSLRNLRENEKNAGMQVR